MVFHKITMKKESRILALLINAFQVEIFKFVLLYFIFFQNQFFKHWEIKQLFDKHLTFIELDL
jgi:hypothetical protein